MRVAIARLLAFASALSAVHATGINCLGSALCSDAPHETAEFLVGYINDIDSNRWYNNGQQVACYKNICAYLQNTGGAAGRNIQGLAPYITGHGCLICGSVPYYYPSDNNVADGELTFDYVSNPCGTGIC